MQKIITLDGSSGVGKGTIAILLAKKLKWHLLDSGALYRALALAAQKSKIAYDNETALAQLALDLDLCFNIVDNEVNVLLNNKNISRNLRLEQTGNIASKLAVFPQVRQALLHYQQNAFKMPGLIADGRDMGTVIFPKARAKFFLSADVNSRAKRRYKQLKQKGNNANLAQIEKNLIERDKRDTERTISPLIAATDAICIDTSLLDINTVFNHVWETLPISIKV